MFACKTKNFHECKLASLSKEMVDKNDRLKGAAEIPQIHTF